MKQHAFGSFALLVAAQVATAGQRAENYEISALPAKRAIVVDGSLNEWDLSAATFACPNLIYRKEGTWTVEGGLKKHSFCASMSAAYDQEHLYLAVRVKDPTPLNNSTDPAVSPGDGWKGDCIQFRLQFPKDNGEIAWLDCWKYDGTKAPAATLTWRGPGRTGMTNALAAGVKSAVVANRAGDGYTLELALPWALIAMKPSAMTPATTLRIGVEISDSGDASHPGGRITDLLACPGAPIAGFYKSPQNWGRLLLQKEKSKMSQVYNVVGTVSHPIPINAAEAILDPLWDPEIRDLSVWTVEGDEAAGIDRNAWTMSGYAVSWQHAEAKNPVIRMIRTEESLCEGYDRFILALHAPPKSRIAIRVETDRGTRRLTHTMADEENIELSLDLGRATSFHRFILEVTPEGQGPGSCTVKWLGLQKSEILPHELARWKAFDATWDKLLKPEGFEPAFTPAYGVLIRPEELEAIRRKHDAFVAAGGKSPYVAMAESLRGVNPEEFISDFSFWMNDKRTSRVRDFDQKNQYASQAAIAGLILKDKELLRLSARAAMALVVTEDWYETFMYRHPLSLGDGRGFKPSVALDQVNYALDLAGEMFTDAGRNLVRRAMVEKGLSPIEYTIMKHEYMFDCNQVAWFNFSRLPAGLILEKAMPRASNATERAYSDVVENVNRILLDDGGYDEGPMYMQVVLRGVLAPLRLYARERGLKFADVLPEKLRNTAHFAEVLASTSDGANMIPTGDCGYGMDMAISITALLAYAYPDSYWVTLFRQSLAKSNGFSGDLLTTILMDQIPERGPELPAFVSMPVMGPMASVRMLDGQRVKLFVMGARKGAGHSHEDKGSFVLECAGDVLACDPAQVSYSSYLVNVMKTCPRHNMLVPWGTAGRPHPGPLPEDVKPVGKGDDKSFSATIDATPGWKGYYRQWQRRWDSPAPNTLTITDSYELESGKGVDFLWQTFLPVEVKQNEVIVTGTKSRAVIRIPEGCKAFVEELPFLEARDLRQKRITIRKEGVAGELRVAVRLEIANP